MTYFGRLITAMVTPFGDDLSIDGSKVQLLTRYLIEEQKTDAIVVAGTTGEAPTLTGEERLELFRLVVDAANGDCQVLGGTGTNSTATTVDLSQRTKGIGLDGIMVVVPYYNKPTQEGVYAHFATVAAKVDLPMMVYNVPGRTGMNVGLETLCRLADIEQIKALKEATLDFDKIALLRKEVGNDFAIYSGDDNLTLPHLAVGCDGVVSVASHVAGTRIKRMIELFKDEVSNERALELHMELLPVFQSVFQTTNPIPIKAALAMVGQDVGGLRPPLQRAGEDDKEAIRKLLVEGKVLN